jgi:DNA polymerase
VQAGEAIRADAERATGTERESESRMTVRTPRPKPSEHRSAADFIPADPTIESARLASAACRGCPLWARATQTVFGAGRADARMMLIGEMPGDQEDVAGEPFVGPAGKLLDRALEAAGIDRAQVYVTNAVKHFKWEPRGRRRLHRTPTPAEVDACIPWLKTEIALVRPELIVCLGATAGRALLGPDFLVTRDRGRMLESAFAPRLVATIHPSALLRLRDNAMREAEYRRLVTDLRLAARALT